MTKYLITGSEGFIGKHLCRRLLTEGHEIVGLDNLAKGQEPGPWPFVQADVRDLQWFKYQPESKVDAVIHLAAINGTANFYERPWEVLDVGTRGIFEVLDLARHRDCPIYLASSSEVYQTVGGKADEKVPLCVPDPHNPRYSYAGSKIISELATINSGVPYVIFRPHNVYGPGASEKHVIPRFFKEALATETTFPIMGDALAARAFTYIDDFIDGLMLVLRKGRFFEIYHIGTEEEKAIIELAMMILKVVGKDPDKVHFKYLPEAARGGPPRRCPDISKMRKLGYEPKVLLKNGLERMYNELSALRG